MAAGLAGADVVMMLRLQRERMARGPVPSAREYFRFYGLDCGEAGLCKARRDRHASGADEPRRGDRQRDRRRSGAQRDQGTGRNGCRRAHGGAGRAVAGPSAGMNPDTLFYRRSRPRRRRGFAGRPAGARRADRGFRRRSWAGRTGRRWSRRRTQCCAPAWSTCAPGLASRDSNIAKRSPRQRSPRRQAGSPPWRRCRIPSRRSTTRRLVQMLRTKGEETGSLTILPYGAVTRGCRGEELAEIGLLREAGAVAFTDGSRAIGSARMMRLALSYARGFGARIVQHPEDPSLAGGGCCDRKRAGHAAGAAGDSGGGRGDDGRAGYPAGGADGRRGAFRACLDRRGAGADPAGKGRRAGGHMRYRAALLRPERDLDRRFSHLRETVAAVAQGA